MALKWLQFRRQWKGKRKGNMNDKNKGYIHLMKWQVNLGELEKQPTSISWVGPMVCVEIAVLWWVIMLEHQGENSLRIMWYVKYDGIYTRNCHVQQNGG